MFQLIRAQLGQVLDEIRELAIICADWREVRVLAPVAGEGLAARMRTENPRIVRNVALVNPQSATFCMQAKRFTRETLHANRRVFRDELDAELWLSEELTEAETFRVREFLGSEP